MAILWNTCQKIKNRWQITECEYILWDSMCDRITNGLI